MTPGVTELREDMAKYSWPSTRQERTGRDLTSIALEVTAKFLTMLT